MKDKIVINGDVFVPMLTEEQIAVRTKEMAARLSQDFEGKTPIFVGVLNGSFMFFSDLVRHFEGDCEVDFLKLSSYGEAKISSGSVTLLKDLNCDIEGRHLIIVEDIVDSGLSVKYILDLIKGHNPASVSIVSLLVKPKSMQYDLKIDYIGFSIPSEFVIGFGLDYAQKYRNLRAVYVLSEDEKNGK